MTDPASDAEHADHSLGETLDIRYLGRQARAHQISANALLGLGAGLAVFASALLLWGGIVEGPVRALLLLLAAAIMPVRLLVNRLSGVTLSDGVVGSPSSTLRRWLHLGEAAMMVAACGFSAFGSGHDMGAVLGLVCAGLALLSGLRGAAGTGFLYGLFPRLAMSLTTVVAAFEPLWGWRGQSFLVGLNVILVVLVVHLLRRRPAASPLPADPA